MGAETAVPIEFRTISLAKSSILARCQQTESPQPRTSDSLPGMQGRLRASLRCIAATLAVGLLLPGSGYAEATESTSSGWQHYSLATLDALVVRPLGIVATVVGAVFVVPVAVFTWPTGRATIDRAVERFFMVQARSTFERPLGEF
jgi:hypothetical protein